MDSDGAVISAGLSVCLACNVGSYSSVTGKTLCCNHFWFHDMIPDRLAVSERVASLNQRITRGVICSLICLCCNTKKDLLAIGAPATAVRKARPDDGLILGHLCCAGSSICTACSSGSYSSSTG